MKAHLAFSEIPLTEYCTIPALCGVDVHNARFEYRRDEPISSILFCSKCFRLAMQPQDKRVRYLYGMVSAEEVREEQVA